MKRPVALTVLLLAMCLTTAAEAVNYPRPALYGGIRSSGWPFIFYYNPLGIVPVPPLDSILDTLVIRQAARHSVICLESNPVTYRPDIINALHAANDSVKVLCYEQLGSPYPTGVNPSDAHARIYTMINTKVNGWLYDTGGTVWLSGLSCIGATNYANSVVADSIAIIIRDNILATGNWDGFFFDCLQDSIAWTDGSAGKHIDYARAGFGSLAALDAAWHTNYVNMMATIRAAYPNHILSVNFNETANKGLEGRMWEGLGPYAGVSPWYNTVAAQIRSDCKYDWTKTETAIPTPNPYTSAIMKQARFVLATACMSSGVSFIGPDRILPSSGLSFPRWWFDEYSVRWTSGDSTARADSTKERTGWLGAPTDSARNVGSGVYMRPFDRGIVLVNPTGTSRTYSSATRYKKITGLKDPTFNDGTIGTSFSVPFNGALFLLFTTPAPPAAAAVFGEHCGPDP